MVNTYNIFIEGMQVQPLAFEEFKKEHIPEYLQYAYLSYKSNNPQLQNFLEQPFNHRTVIIINAILEAGELVNKKRGTSTIFSRFLRIDGKMALAYISCEFHHFMKEIVPNDICEIDYHAIPKDMLNGIEEFKGLMFLRLAVREEFKDMGLYRYLENDKSKYYLQQGYEYGVHLVRLPQIVARFRKYGAEVKNISDIVKKTPVKFDLCIIEFRTYFRNMMVKGFL